MEEDHQHEHGTADQHSTSSLKVKPKLSLDKYFGVLASGDYSGFSMRDLNMILSINGYKQINGKKDQLMEAVSKMELKDFSRSTLGECIHPAPMTLTNVIKDLTQMNWQACPVVSVRSISSTRYNTKSPTCNPKDSVDPAGLKSATKKRKNNKKTGPVTKPESRGKSGKYVASGEDNSKDQKDDGVLMIGTSGSSSSTMPEENPKPKNKRKRKVSQKVLEHLSSGDMLNLSLELGIFA